MPTLIETPAFQYDELDDDAQAKARDWYRTGAGQDFDWSCTLDDCGEALEGLGVTFDRHAIRTMGGATRSEREINFSGFSSQGDGASWTGSYAYRPGALQATREERPTDKELIGIAEQLQALQARHFYRLQATVSRRSRHYSHEMTVSADVTRTDDAEVSEADQDALEELLRDTMRWTYRRLEADYDWQQSDEIVAENIQANEYAFTEDGRRHCYA